jgi:Leucine Rich repeat
MNQKRHYCSTTSNASQRPLGVQCDGSDYCCCLRCMTGDMSITTLNISANNIGDKGAAALAEMLRSNTTLERLDLSSNVIDYDGISALSAALADNTSLKALYVRCCLRPQNNTRLCMAAHALLQRHCPVAFTPGGQQHFYGAVTTTSPAWAPSCWQMR